MTGGKGLNPALNPNKITRVESPLLTISNAAAVITWTHNLGFKFDFVEAQLVCIGSQYNYSPGEIVPLNNLTLGITLTTTKDYGSTLWMTDNTVNMQEGIDGFLIHQRSATVGDMNTPTPANWKLRFIGYKIDIGDVPDITRVGFVALEQKVALNGDADLRFDLQQYFNEYETFLVIMEDVALVNDGIRLQMRMSTDGGATFESGASDYETMLDGVLNNANSIFSSAESSIRLSTALGTASIGEHLSGYLYVYGANNPASWTRVDGGVVGRSSAAAEFRYDVAGDRAVGQITTDIQFMANTGNLEGGNFTLYGLRKVA